MADVWLATMKGLHGFAKKVVLKTIRPALVENADFVEMFKNEALLVAGLNHPNIVQILDLGEIDGRYFIAMEYVAGRSLRQISRRAKKMGKLVEPWFVLRTIITACEALQFAHDFCDEGGRSLGLIHRDVSPENIMVSFSGSVKIVDFGVAKATASPDATVAGQLKGKLAYLPPEQIHAQPLDRRVDVYALGIVLYEMLTGRRPYDGENTVQILANVVGGKATPPRQVSSQIPFVLDRIVMRAMAPEAARRYPEAAALADELSRFLDRQGDRHTQKELGVYVSQLFPNEPDIPHDVKRLIGDSSAPPDLEEEAGIAVGQAIEVSHPQPSQVEARAHAVEAAAAKEAARKKQPPSPSPGTFWASGALIG